MDQAEEERKASRRARDEKRKNDIMKDTSSKVEMNTVRSMSPRAPRYSTGSETARGPVLIKSPGVKEMEEREAEKKAARKMRDEKLKADLLRDPAFERPKNSPRPNYQSLSPKRYPGASGTISGSRELDEREAEKKAARKARDEKMKKELLRGGP